MQISFYDNCRHAEGKINVGIRWGGDEESVFDELINSPVKNSNLNIFTKDDSTTMKTLNNEEFTLSIANSLEVIKPNSVQGLEGKVTSDRVCGREEAFKVGNAGVYEHEKITPSSISESDGVIGNMTVKDKYDGHMCITREVTEILRTNFNDVTEDLIYSHEVSNVKVIDEKLHYNQVLPRSDNRTAGFPIENKEHGAADDVYKVNNDTMRNIFDFGTLTEEDNLDKKFLEAESNLPGKERISIVKEFEDTFNFKIMSEKDNLNDWLLSAEISSFRDKSKKNLTKVGDKSSLFHDFFCDTEVVRLAVRENRFVSANGIIIVHKEEEKSSVFMDIRLTFIYCAIETEKLGPSWAKQNHN